MIMMNNVRGCGGEKKKKKKEEKEKTRMRRRQRKGLIKHFGNAELFVRGVE